VRWREQISRLCKSIEQIQTLQNTYNSPLQRPQKFSLIVSPRLSATMVELPNVQTLTHSLVQTQPFVAVFTGGTSGIGAPTLKAFANTSAQHSSHELRAYIIGRNASAARKLIAEY
jgi:hypothetical protein